MHSHSSIKLLKSLDEKELKALGDFIKSPYFNKSEILIKLFDIIAKQHPEYTGKSLQKENLYKKLYPGKPFNEQSMRSRISELSALIKKFFIQKSFEKNELLQKMRYIKELGGKYLFDIAERQIDETEQSLLERSFYDLDFYEEMNKLLNERALLYNAMDKKRESQKLSFKKGEYLLNYFLNSLLQINHEIACVDIEKGDVKDKNYVKYFLDKFDFEGYLKQLEAENYSHYPFLGVNYYGMASVMAPENEEYFFRLKDLVFTHYKKFDVVELTNCWSMLSNSAFVNYINKGDSFVKEGHEINKFFIEKKLYRTDRPFSTLAYQNTIINAIMVKDLDWAEKFAGEYKDVLISEVRDNRYNFCIAMILFERGEYEKSLEHLSRVQHADWHFKIGVRMYYLKNYYELGMAEPMMSLLDSFKHFASDNKSLPEYVDERVKQSLYYITKIAGAKFDGKKLDIADYKTAERNKNFTHKEWILQKIKELI